MKITATIVVYQPKMDWLMNSINSFIEKDNFTKKLYLIDNSPNPNKELEALVSDKIEYIFNNCNVGFGKAHNQGIKKATAEKSDYHLILNPDVLFDSDIIVELANELKNDEAIGLISPKIIYTHGEVQRLCKLLPNPMHLIVRRLLHKSKRFIQLNYKLELMAFGYNHVAEIPWLSGCFLLARTSHLQRMGGFDERYFLYMEDIDLSRRSLRYYKNIFYPNVTIQHVFEKGSYKSLKLTIVHLISAIRYFTKWGWFFDRERKFINDQALEKLGIHEKSSDYLNV
jgi:GT2 family glycosyltransferase